MSTNNAFLIGLFLACIFHSVYLQRRVEEIEGYTKELQSKVDTLNSRHALYLEHLSRCAFIDRDDLEEGYQGYLRFRRYRKGHTH